MAEENLPLAEMLAKAGDGDFLRNVAETVVQMLMEADVEGVVGAGRHERTAERLTYRNGYRDRALPYFAANGVRVSPERDGVRVSLGMFNTVADIDGFVDVVRRRGALTKAA